MIAESSTASEPKALLWVGRVLSTLPVLLLIMSGIMKLLNKPEVVEGFKKFGYDPRLAFGLGIVELVSTVLYVIPQTSVLGAILLTGYLGGATATHVRIGDPYFPPIVLGVLLWGGLVLRDARLRAVLPWRCSQRLAQQDRLVSQLPQE